MAAVPRPAPPAPATLPPPAPAVEPVPTPAAPSPAALPANVSVTLRAGGTTWVRVTSDGRRSFEGMLHNGDLRTWSGTQITVRVGNAPVVAVEVNGRRVPIPAGLRVWQQTFTSRP